MLVIKDTVWTDCVSVSYCSLRKKYDKLNNETLPKVTHDKEAKIGCKGKNKFWYGYKKHVSVDIKSSLIKQIAITYKTPKVKHICPKQGAIYADKGYCSHKVRNLAFAKNAHLATTSIYRLIKD